MTKIDFKHLWTFIFMLFSIQSLFAAETVFVTQSPSSIISSKDNYRDYKIHILKHGETISEILQLHGYTPLYGHENWVAQTLKINHLPNVDAKEIKKVYQ